MGCDVESIDGDVQELCLQEQGVRLHVLQAIASIVAGWTWLEPTPPHSLRKYRPQRRPTGRRQPMSFNLVAAWALCVALGAAICGDLAQNGGVMM